MRPMFLEFPALSTLSTKNDSNPLHPTMDEVFESQFMFGPRFLVAPVLEYMVPLCPAT